MFSPLWYLTSPSGGLKSAAVKIVSVIGVFSAQVSVISILSALLLPTGDVSVGTVVQKL